MADNRKLYLDLLKKSLADALHVNTFTARLAGDGEVQIEPTSRENLEKRLVGLDWPACGETMIGLRRLDNLQFCIEEVLRLGVPGDLIETGVWRGGACIFMRGCLKAHDVSDRSIWVADSFQGLPPPDAERHPQDSGDIHSTVKFLAVSEEQVRENFSRYELLDGQVKFLKGWFRDTLPGLKNNQWALLRLDGDMYESTMDGLQNLYHNLSPGGFVIIDDYGCLPNCKRAVDDFRAANSINEPMQEIDWTGVYWQKSRA